MATLVDVYSPIPLFKMLLELVNEWIITSEQKFTYTSLKSLLTGFDNNFFKRAPERINLWGLRHNVFAKTKKNHTFSY